MERGKSAIENSNCNNDDVTHGFVARPQGRRLGDEKMIYAP